jgi:hypothetical protein
MNIIRQKPHFAPDHETGKLVLIPGAIACHDCFNTVVLPARHEEETMCSTCGATYNMCGMQVHPEPEPCPALMAL